MRIDRLYSTPRWGGVRRAGKNAWLSNPHAMKRSELERHLRSSGCVLDRQGGRHAIWLNPANEARAAVPRHTDIKRNTARRICDDLGIPRARGL
jgi:predicted RNA binding protein YcfA (HicA-like mRNA interferase family)